MDYPILHKAEVNTPPPGFQSLFYDAGNNNVLTAKNADCTYTIVQAGTVNQSLIDQATAKFEKILEDAGCAMTKGIITAEQYESIVDNINICFDVIIDPVTGSQQICISNSPTIFVTLSTTNVLCNGGTTGTAGVSVNGGTPPFVVDWGAGVDETALSAGSYMVTVTDSVGKTKGISFIITEPAALSSINSTTNESAPAAGDGTASVVVSGGTTPYTYLWDDPGAQITPTATGLDDGDYNCVITDANGCTLEVGPLTVGTD